MKQVIQNYRTGTLKVEEVPAPTVREGGLLVATQVSLISAGTERSTVQVAQKSLAGKAMERPDLVRKVLNKIQKEGVVDTLRMVFERLDTPAALGYSAAGIVLEVGKRVEGFSVGDRVACTGQNYASHAAMISVPKNLCVKMPEGIDFEEGAFVALGAIALQGVRQAEPQLGDRVAVIGLGLLGQLTVQLLKAAGCAVLASDFDPAKIALATALGADVAAPPDRLIEAAAGFTQGAGLDAILITASTKENGPVEMAGEIARKKGRVVVVGAVGMEIPREPYYKKELELRLSTSYGPGRYDPEYEEKGHDYPYGYVRWTEGRNMEAFLALIAQKKVDVKRLITHRYPIQEAEQAYRLMMEGGAPYLGIMLSYPGQEKAKPNRVVHLRKGSRSGRVQLGIIGAGSHVKDRLLPVLSGIKEVSLRAICTASGIHAKALAEKSSAVYCASDYREVLKDEEINAVLIGTRHRDHGQMVVESLRAGKHVFVEKPLCLSEEELEEITAVYEAKATEGIQLMVGFNRRFSPHMAQARALFQDRKNPLVMLYRVNAGALPPDHWVHDPEIGGGRILGEACHFIDCMQALCGSVPTSVHARRIDHHTSGITEDQSLLSFSFADGSIGTVIYTAGGDTALAKERFEAFGEGKAVIINDFIKTESFSGGKGKSFKTSKQDKGFQTEMTRFVEAIQGGTPAMSFAEIQAVTRATLRAVESGRTGAVYALGE
ncbi:MAG: bi-domain-containing oxidoreductase [Candidatus Manganitrophus sp. SB1]|nr:bi-domain-containing oxidoreductase [Candidatus Manganitrophus morganii]